MTKKCIKVIVVLFCVFSVLGYPFFAQADTYEWTDVSEEQILQTAIKDVALIEDYLARRDTSIEKELLSTEQEFIDLSMKLRDDGDRRKMSELARATRSLYNNYMTYQSCLGTKTISENGGVPDVILSGAVAAALAYFSVNNYILARELLAHSLDTQIWSTYLPVNGPERIYNTMEFYYVYASENDTGPGMFVDEGTVSSRDCKYAIHKFNYAKLPNREILIADDYDFSIDLDYSGIEGVAVNSMALAMYAGIITPYHILCFVSY